MFTDSTPPYMFDAAEKRGINEAVAILKTAMFELGEGTQTVATGEQFGATQAEGIFLVHGHDARKEEVARVLRLLTGEEPTILHEQPNRGQTIIEKFERHAGDKAFAVILATADDIGSEGGGDAATPRARQNVIFEMGFFVGAIGRDRLAVLHDEGVELPSDYQGVVYIPLDESGAGALTSRRNCGPRGSMPTATSSSGGQGWEAVEPATRSLLGVAERQRACGRAPGGFPAWARPSRALTPGDPRRLQDQLR